MMRWEERQHERYGYKKGVCTDFHLCPSAYVKMLSLSPSQVLPLHMLELSVRKGLWGARVRAGGRKSGKISILNKRNFVTLSPDNPNSPFSAFSNFPSPRCSFRASLCLQLPPFNFVKNCKSAFTLKSPDRLMNRVSHPFEFCECLIALLLFFFFFTPQYHSGCFAGVRS